MKAETRSAGRMPSKRVRATEVAERSGGPTTPGASYTQEEDHDDEFDLGKGFIVKSFKTYHVVPSQVRNKLPVSIMRIVLCLTCFFGCILGC